MRRIALLAVLMAVIAPPGNAAAANRTFPGCKGKATLAACIGSAPAGSTITLRTNALIPIPDELTLAKGVNLVAAKGFKPRIGRVGAPAYVEFELSGSADVTITGIRFEQVSIQVEAVTGTGHTLVFSKNRIRFDSGSNGDRGVGLFIASAAKGTITARDNDVSASGSGIEAYGSGGPVVVTGNLVTAPVADDSQLGITAGLGGSGTYPITVANNVMHHIVGCNCGNVTALTVDVRDAASANVRVLNNTIGDLAVAPGNGAEGIAVYDPAPSGTGHVNLWLYNNVVYNTHSIGYRIDADNLTVLGNQNASFGNLADSFGGHSVGFLYTADPMFVAPASGNYRLSATSELTDEGTTCIAGLPIPRSDAAGKLRLAGRGVDMGAYERGSKSSGSVKGVSKSGSNGANTLTGTSGRDVLCGLGGNDKLFGKGGGDFLIGGLGRDKAFGGEGSDRIDLRDLVPGNDRAYGGPGNDVCVTDANDRKFSC